MADHDSRCERVITGETTTGSGRTFPTGFLICHCARRARRATGLLAIEADRWRRAHPEAVSHG